jgi:hypothetical protein
VGVVEGSRAGAIPGAAGSPPGSTSTTAVAGMEAQLQADSPARCSFAAVRDLQPQPQAPASACQLPSPQPTAAPGRQQALPQPRSSGSLSARFVPHGPAFWQQQEGHQQELLPVCVGVGLVRAVDAERGELYILTPLPAERLEQVRLQSMLEAACVEGSCCLQFIG